MKTIKNYETISTKNGDKGMSRNYSNELISKSDILFDVLGNIDELSSLLGLIYHKTTFKDPLKVIQKVLQHINSVIATTDERRRNTLVKVTDVDVMYLETLEQKLLNDTEIKPVFVLPGSDTSLEGAYFDMARSVARRAERFLTKFYMIHERTDLGLEARYLNRLSDLLFILSRHLEETK